MAVLKDRTRLTGLLAAKPTPPPPGLFLRRCPTVARAFFSILAASATALSLVLGACQTPPPPPAAYDYSQPVPEGDLLGDEWFDDSAVIGHSLMEGFEGFAKISSNIHYFTATGLSAAGTTGYSKFDLPNGGRGTLKKGLGQKQFSKIYIMLGTNEITTSKERYKQNMQAILDVVRETQGEDIPIYILNATPTTKKKSDSSPFNLKNIQKLNEAIAELCEEQECYLVDVYSCFADQDGYLPSNISTDGVHLTASQYRIMADYILSHTVEE